MRYIKKKKSYNFSQEDFLRMAKYGVYCFGENNQAMGDQQDSVQQGNYYTVKKDDTLSGISQNARTTVEKVMSVNQGDIANADNIREGMKIRLPDDSGRVRYAFKEGDTGYDIAKRLSVPWKDIDEANPGFNWSRAKIGAEIWVPRTSVALSQQKIESNVEKNPSIVKTSIEDKKELKAEDSNKEKLDPKLYRDNSAFWSFRRKDKKYPSPIVDVKDINSKDLLKGVYSDKYGVFTLDGNPIQYKIQKGDNLDLIAKRNNTTVSRLLADNKGIDPLKLRIGQNIMIQKLKGNVSEFDEKLIDLKAPIEWEAFDEVARQGEGEPYYTIGFGHHHKDVKQGETITREKALAIYEKDSKAVIDAIKRWNSNNKLTPYQYQVLFDYGYNVGVGDLQKILVNYVNKGKLRDAIKQMTPTNQYNKRPGLKDRHDWRKYYWGYQKSPSK